MTGPGANSLTAFGLLFGLYGYLGRTDFAQFFGLALTMLIVVSLILGMVAAGGEILAGMQRAWARLGRSRSYATIPSWYLTD